MHSTSNIINSIHHNQVPATSIKSQFGQSRAYSQNPNLSSKPNLNCQPQLYTCYQFASTCHYLINLTIHHLNVKIKQIPKVSMAAEMMIPSFSSIIFNFSSYPLNSTSIQFLMKQGRRYKH